MPIASSRKRKKFLRCGRRFGKTEIFVGRGLENALEFPDSINFYIAPTYKQGKLIAWELLLKKVRERVPKALVHTVNNSELFIEVGNHGRFYIKGADDPDSLRGVKLKSAFLDEYKDFKESVLDEIIEPALLDEQGELWVGGTPGGFNHMYRLELKARSLPEEWDVFHYTTYDNPFLSKKDIDLLKTTTSLEIFEQEYMAEYKRFLGLVYKEFDYQRHVFTGPTPTKEWVEVFAGVDFGFTNPMAANIIKRDRDNHFWVIPSSYYKTGQLTSDLIAWAKQMIAEEKVNKWYPDSAEPDRIKEMSDSPNGLNCLAVSKTEAAFLAGIDRIRELLRTGRLHISAECKDLIYEFERYSYPKTREGYNEKEKPVDAYNHALDALRYAIYSNDAVAPEEIRVDDFALYGTNYN